MKVSIVIPIYGVEAEIEKCLESVISQDYPKIEIILVNDCTPDQSFIIAKNYLEYSDYSGELKLIEHTENKGLSCARNSGIDSATGEYLFFLDSDDALTTADAISILCKEVHKYNDVEAVQGMAQYLHDNQYIPIKYSQLDKVYLKPKAFDAYAKGKLPTTAWGKLISREFIKKHDLYFQSGIYYEDDLWSFYFYKNMEKLIVVENIVYDYFLRDGSITQSNITEKKLKDLYFIIKNIYEEYPKSPKNIGRVIKRLERSLLKYLFALNDEVLIRKYLSLMRDINIPIFSVFDIRYIEQGLLLKLPMQLQIAYGRYKWG